MLAAQLEIFILKRKTPLKKGGVLEGSPRYQLQYVFFGDLLNSRSHGNLFFGYWWFLTTGSVLLGPRKGLVDPKVRMIILFLVFIVKDHDLESLFSSHAIVNLDVS